MTISGRMPACLWRGEAAVHLGRLNVGEGLHLGLVDDHDILLVDVLLVDVPARELLRLVHLLGGR